MSGDDRLKTLRLFGSPGLFDDGDIVAIGKRARGMLGYLALSNPRRASRERLTGLFWPDRAETQARASLRQGLVELRGAVGDAIVSKREWVALEADHLAGDWRLVDAALAKDDPALLTAALAAIGAEPLLDGLEFGEAFDDWLRGMRTALDARLAAAVLRQVEAAADPAAALALADAWLLRDPRDEAVAAAAIAIEMGRSAPAAARRRYRAFEETLARDGDGPPGPAVQAALNRAAMAPAASPETSVAVQLARGTDLELPSKPSLAILPFANLSGGDQDHFSDGMVEEISTVLSNYSGLFVIAGQSSLSYRGSLKPAQQIARELGVRYLLEGSVRRADDNVRISVKLVDAGVGQQIWADRFDERLENIFELQDRVATAVATRIDSTIITAELLRAHTRPAASPGAYELYLRAAARLAVYDREAVLEAIDYAERAVAIDPNYAWAISTAAFCHGVVYLNRWSADPEASRTKAWEMAQRALRVSVDDEEVLAEVAGLILNIGGDVEQASQLIERALELNPERPFSLFWAAWVDLESGKTERALERFEKALRINPRAWLRAFALAGMGNCLFVLERFEEAVFVQSEAIRLRPDYPPAQAVLVASLARNGRFREAKAAHERLKQLGGIETALYFFRHKPHRKLLRSAFDGLARFGEMAD